jgi:N-dimethylarginine dimethylaminohydrolase
MDTITTTLQPVGVTSEWGDLKECVYGWPEEFIIPKFLDDSKARAYGDFERFWTSNQGRNVKDADADYAAAVKTQVNAAVDILKSLGVRVQQPTYHTEANLKFPRGENHGSMTPWMRDPFVTIGNNVIELSPRSLFHRRQRFPIRHILASTMDRGARYFAQPDAGADDYNEAPGFGYLEGGDIFVLGKKILVGHSGNCSNAEGGRWLQHALGSEYDVEMVTLDKLFPHLDCVLMTPREGLVVACEEAFVEGLPEHIRDWERIVVSKEDAKRHMACNNLVINDRTVMLPAEEALDNLASELKRRKFEVIRTPYDALGRVGGSFRCAHQPLVRI